MKTIDEEFREMPELPETAPAELDIAFSWQDESDTQSLDDENDKRTEPECELHPIC